jgi:hypothetical protein
MGDSEGQLARRIRRAGTDPFYFATLVHQVLNARLQVVLRFEQRVLGFGEKTKKQFGSRRPCWRQHQ